MATSLIYREAFLEFDRRNFAEAQRLCERCIQDRTLGHEDFGNTLLLLANCHAARGETDAAAMVYRSCFAFLQEHLGPAYTGLASVLVNHAVLLMDRFPASEEAVVREPMELLHEAKKLLENRMDIQRLVLADVYENLGVCHEQLGHYTEALSCYTRSLRIRAKFTDERGEVELQLARTLENVAMLQRLAGRQSAALPILDAVAATRRTHLGPKDPAFLRALFHAAIVAKELHRHQLAEQRMLQCFAARMEVLGPHHPDTQLALQFLDCASPRVLRALDVVLAETAREADSHAVSGLHTAATRNELEEGGRGREEEEGWGENDDETAAVGAVGLHWGPAATRSPAARSELPPRPHTRSAAVGVSGDGAGGGGGGGSSAAGSVASTSIDLVVVAEGTRRPHRNGARRSGRTTTTTSSSSSDDGGSQSCDKGGWQRRQLREQHRSGNRQR